MPKLSVQISRTINLGNFESVRVQVGLEDEFPKEINLEEVYAEIYSKVKQNLYCALEEILNSPFNNPAEFSEARRSPSSPYRVPVSQESFE